MFDQICRMFKTFFVIQKRKKKEKQASQLNLVSEWKQLTQFIAMVTGCSKCMFTIGDDNDDQDMLRE